MLIVGLTGSIGMGKSTAANRFRFRGVSVFDADACVHQLYSGAAVQLIEDAFPGSTRDGVVDRQALSQLLDGQSARFRKLEAIVHPLVQAEERKFIHDAVRDGQTSAVLEIPLLFETGLDAKVDIVVVVTTSEAIQRARVLERPGMSPEKLDAILAQQMPDAEKRAKADFIVDTSGTFEASEAQIDHIVARFPKLDGTAFETHWR